MSQTGHELGQKRIMSAQQTPRGGGVNICIEKYSILKAWMDGSGQMQALHGRWGPRNHKEVLLGAGYTQGMSLIRILYREIHGLDGI